MFRKVKNGFSCNHEDSEDKAKPVKGAKPVEPSPKTSKKNAPLEAEHSRDKSQMTQLQSLKTVKSATECKSKKQTSAECRSSVETNLSQVTMTNFDVPVVRRMVSKSFFGSDVAMDDRSTSSLSRIRQISERAVRRVKTFVSRPIKEATLERFVGLVEAKKQAEESGKISTREMKLGDDPFPKPKPRSTKSVEGGVQDHARSVPDFHDFKSVSQMPVSSRYDNLPSGCRLVVGNKNNNGNLIIDGEPFWTEQRKPTESDLEDSNTDDELQMSAEVALDVFEGRVKLVNMPAIPVVLDPMNELRELQRRDKLFYTKDVLFGNSVRSMINLYDNSLKATPIVKKKSELVNFKEPLIRYTYRRGSVFNVVKEPFAPRDRKKLSRKSSRKRKKRSVGAEERRDTNEELRKKVASADDGKGQKSAITHAVVEKSRGAHKQELYEGMFKEGSTQLSGPLFDVPKEDLENRAKLNVK